MDFPSVINLNCSNCKIRSSHLSSSVPLSPGSNLFDNGMNRKKYSNMKRNNANYIPVISHNNIHKTKISNENENENFMDVMNSFSPNRRKRENENENDDDRNDGRNISSSGQKYLIIDDDDCIDDNNNNNDINLKSISIQRRERAICEKSVHLLSGTLLTSFLFHTIIQ